MSGSLLVIAGEVSGDMHAAPVVDILKRQRPELQVWGIGGDELQAAGMAVHYHVRDMSVMGLGEVLRRYGFFRRVFHSMVREAAERRPDAVLLIDYPGFNLRFAKQMKKRGIPVFYYVCPQVWAWHRSRIPAMAKIIDRLLVIFPFEVEVFAGTGLPVDFVGHPLVDRARQFLQQPESPLPWAGGAKLALLPGSRRQEVERILPAMLGALEHWRPDTRPAVLIAASGPETAGHIRAVLQRHGGDQLSGQIIIGRTREILRQADAALVTSGTATLEAAMMDCPMIVVYKTGFLTYTIGRRLIAVDHIGMVNIVAGRTVCPERIQHEASPHKLQQAVDPLLRDTEQRRQMKKDLAEVRQRLGDGGCAERVAAAVGSALKIEK